MRGDHGGVMRGDHGGVIVSLLCVSHHPIKIPVVQRDGPEKSLAHIITVIQENKTASISLSIGTFDGCSKVCWSVSELVGCLWSSSVG